jgi:hypothetical protein
MKKVVRLINILDTEIVDKLIYLDRLVKFYSRFLYTWKIAEVTSNGSVVRIKFFTVSKHGFESFTEREFPITDIDKRIASYKRKIKKEFSERAENPRIQREKEIRKWEKYIEDAKIQMYD